VNIFLERTIQTYFFTLVGKTALASQHKYLVICSKTLSIIGQLVAIINGRPFNCNGETLVGLEVRGFRGYLEIDSSKFQFKKLVSMHSEADITSLPLERRVVDWWP